MIFISELNSIKKVLSPLGLYNLSENSLVSKEIEVYEIEIERVKEVLKNLLREYFINTACDYGLTLKEKLFGSVKTDLSLENRRKILLNRCSSKSYGFNRESVEKSLISAGIEGYVVENPQNNSLYINCLNRFDTTITKEMAENIVLKFIPAHLSVDFDFRILTWSYIDDLDMTFSEMDQSDLTWEQIDNYES